MQPMQACERASGRGMDLRARLLNARNQSSPARDAERTARMKRVSTPGPRPFLKWVGGKTQLLPELEARLPQNFAETVRVYAEPFVGGGALLFHLLSKGLRPERVIVNDSNPDLANAYRVVKEYSDDLLEALSRFDTEYRDCKSEAEQRSFFIGVRCAFNAGKISWTTTPSVERAAELLFLNKTCFNGLYRVNAKGLFNVPHGKYVDPSICDTSAIQACSIALSDVEIMSADFAEAVTGADRGWFVYFDPPYRPISATSAFRDYTQGGFDDSEQRRLAALCRKLDQCGARWLQSNSDAGDGFFDDLYHGFQIDRVLASRAINSKGTGRGKISEVLIRNAYEVGS